MSWRTAAMPDSPTRVRSITLRLIGGYTLAALIALSAASFFLHRGLKQRFEVAYTQLLTDCVDTVRRDIQARDGDLHEARELITQSAGSRQIGKYYCRLIHIEGRVIEETPGAGDYIPPAEAFSAPVAPGEPLTKLTAATAPNGHPVWIGSALVERARHRPMTFQLALDVRPLLGWLEDYRNNLILVTAAAAAAMALMGLFITRRSLRPLQEITAATQRITASGLGEHIGTRPWPRELASLAAEFDRMLERLRGSFDRLSQFTADAAHEFRTPLNNLLGGTSLALARPRSPEDYHNILEANLEEYHRLNHMMESLLFLARADNAQTVLKTESFETAALIQEVGEFFSALAEDRGIIIVCRGGGSLNADATLFRMALTNLLSNAIRHSPDGTTITVRAVESPDGLTVSVEDEGEGIDAEHLPRLFDRFYRAESSRTSHAGHSGHSGLGLALVKTIMDLHGGSVSVESAPGSGSCFRLHFPPSAAALPPPSV